MVKKRPGMPTFVLQVWMSSSTDISTAIYSDSYIFRFHTLECKRFQSDPKHVPSWRKKEKRNYSNL